MYFKMAKGLAPGHLKEILPPSVTDNASYKTQYNTESSLRTVPYYMLELQNLLTHLSYRPEKTGTPQKNLFT